MLISAQLPSVNLLVSLKSKTPVLILSHVKTINIIYTTWHPCLVNFSILLNKKNLFMTKKFQGSDSFDELLKTMSNLMLNYIIEINRVSLKSK